MRNKFIQTKHLTMFLVIPLFGLIISVGCKKKNRLSSDTYDFIINPPATNLIKGGTKTFTAEGTAMAGSVSTTPSWVISPTAGATSNSNFAPAPSVTINFNQTGLYTLTATFQNKSAQSQINVNLAAGIPLGAFNIYSDAGLPLGAGLDKSIPSTEITDPAVAPEGSKYTEFTMQGNTRWGVLLNSGSPIDINQYTKLVFYLRKDRSTSSQPLVLQIIKPNNSEWPIGSSSGWSSPGLPNNGLADPESQFTNGGINVWQKVVIDLSEFGLGGGSVLIKEPFQLFTSVQIKIDVDAVYLE